MSHLKTKRLKQNKSKQTNVLPAGRYSGEISSIVMCAGKRIFVSIVTQKNMKREEVRDYHAENRRNKHKR